MFRRSFQPSEAVYDIQLFCKIRPRFTSYGGKESLKAITAALHVTFMLQLTMMGIIVMKCVKLAIMKKNLFQD